MAAGTTRALRAEKQLVVGVAELLTSNEPGAKIITHALGSCIGITAYDPVARVGGLLHFMLPNPPKESKPADKRPHMYATTGIPHLFKKIMGLGGQRERLIICAAGAAEVLDGSGYFAIGQRNRTMMRKIFWKRNVILAAEDTGGVVARTMALDLETGTVTVKIKGKEAVLWSR